jgi:cystine transport system ATP-binding protein/L-cystine transport system ATP-binding protein
MLLEAKKVTKSFGSHDILKGIDLSVDTGEVAVILGPSGAGKTTLLRCLNFLEIPDSGTLIFEGQSYTMNHMARNEIRKYRLQTAFVFQNFNLFLNKTALQNVTEGLVIARKIDKEQAEKKGLQALERVGLLSHRDHYPHQLSGGQQQRVAIARALAADPQIIFFDEPTSALDPELTGEVLSVIRNLANDGMTMLIVTHEVEFARTVSNKTIFMENGVVVESGPTSKVFNTPDKERTAAFLKSFNRF